MPASAADLAASLSSRIGEERVLAAIAGVPRDRFTPPSLRRRAYEDVALPIGCAQTISQPFVVARMLELLELTGSERALDVGTGSGYHAAVLARLVAHVCSIERHPDLSRRAGRTLRALGIDNVELFVGDGSLGLPSRAPFDAINVAAAIAAPVPAALVHQLAPGGRLIVPVCVDPNNPEQQNLVLLRSGPEGVAERVLEQVRFVPLVTEPP